MMNKGVILTAILVLSGCVQVTNYNDVVKAHAPAELVGVWQSTGPQRALSSPEAMASLVVTAEGDTLDCRQWQRVIAVPGKLTRRSDTLYNVTNKREIYKIRRDGAVIKYDGMTLAKVTQPTPECADYLAKHPLNATASPQSDTAVNSAAELAP